MTCLLNAPSCLPLQNAATGIPKLFYTTGRPKSEELIQIIWQENKIQLMLKPQGTFQSESRLCRKNSKKIRTPRGTNKEKIPNRLQCQ